ncbi:bb02905e-a6b5-44a0-b1cb-607825c8e916 [Thermothielavioides terrestris]|uniref:Bb02905e-a6b5-44a0-b1cb-607825c8e916 n=1 Tax=Thermothielavioides terrestris TaxID=2587410 RepID=A0A3S5CXP3_9PEZI|nr:bb02905e-a6b5-44a0-b1cb-607825c8e916 [Thermothielavioides terrestris]
MRYSRCHLLGTLLPLVPFSTAAPAESVRFPRHATVVDHRAVANNYTFIIAGGGIAGLTLADRLTEDPNVTVLVIEAGPLDQGQDGILVPGAYAPYLYFWPNLITVPQAGLNNRTPGAITAQVVGGGSTINAMVFLRGDADDYDAWGSLGNPGWSWQGLLPYFIKSENFTAPDASFAATANISWDDSIRGHSGPVMNSYPNYFYPGSANWWNAALEIGLPAVKDPQAGSKEGVFWMPTDLDATTMTRDHARRNHYDRVKDSRPNYHLLTSNIVCQVLFMGKVAIGVSYVPTSGGGSSCTSSVYASKEVILAAGGFGTPKILQLSGVGPRKLLNKLGIPVVADLPGVGQNLQDQPTLTIPYNFTANVVPNYGTLLTNSTYNAEQRALYDSFHEGAYTIVSSLSTNIGALSLQQATSSYKDIIAAAKAANPAYSLPADVDPTVLKGYKAQRAALLNQFASPNVGVGTVHWGTSDSALIYHLKPLSRGTVNINSTDPLASPLIDFRTATDPVDLQVYTAIFRKNRELFAAPSMQLLGPTEAAPFGAHLTTDAEIAAVMRDQINPTNAHQCCTAAMLPLELGGVVSSDQKVYGVQGLRVADISHWPFQLSGAPMATMYASAERLADLIKKQYCLAGAC